MNDDALDDEAIGRFEDEDVPHPVLVEERAHGAKDFLEVLPRAALVDPHGVGFLLGTSRWAGPRECSQRPGGQQGDESARVPIVSWCRPSRGRHRSDSSTASSPATRASLTIRAVFARTDAPAV